MRFIDRYNKFISKNKYLVLTFWLIVLGFSIWIGPKFISSTSSHFEAPKDSPAYIANKILSEEFSTFSNESSLIILIRNDNGSVLNNEVKNYSQELVNEIKSSSNYDVVTQLIFYWDLIKYNFSDIAQSYVSKNNQSLIIPISIDVTSKTKARAFIDDVKAIVRNSPLNNRYFVGVTSFNILFDDMKKGTEQDLARMDSIVLPIALIVLAIVLRSARLMIIPIIAIGVSVFSSYTLMYWVSRVMNVFSFVPSMMMSVVIAISIDYSLFLLTRYREEIFNNKQPEDAVALMSEHAGHTITVSGLTLTVTFLGLVFFPLELLSTIGIGAGIAVIMTLIVNLSLTPSLLLIFKRFFSSFTLYKKLGRKMPKSDEERKQFELQKQLKSIWYKVGKFSTKYSIVVIIIVTLVAVPVSIQVIKLHKTIDFNQVFPRNSIARQTFSELKKDFPAGELSPHYLIVTTDVPNGVLTEDFFIFTQKLAYNLTHYTALNDSSITGISWVKGQPIFKWLADSYLNPKNNDTFAIVYKQLFQQYTNGDNSSALFEINTPFDPFGDYVEEWIKDARRIIKAFQEHSSYHVYLAGGSTEVVDSIDKVYELFPMMITITMVIIYVLIALMFRSAFVPLRLIITIALTLSWIYGLSVLVFEYNFFDNVFPALQEVESLYWIVPIMAFSILIGLGLDYDIFLLSRISEFRNLGYTDKASIIKGLYKTGGIISAAGIIMAVSFSGLLMSNEMVMNQFGFMLCIAVLVDTFVIRTILVPAIMSIAEKWNWWPMKKPEPKYDIITLI